MKLPNFHLNIIFTSKLKIQIILSHLKIMFPIILVTPLILTRSQLTQSSVWGSPYRDTNGKNQRRSRKERQLKKATNPRNRHRAKEAQEEYENVLPNHQFQQKRENCARPRTHQARLYS